jgi:intracellular sulfur oxidation DsrE/DsrF family protein
MTGQQGNVIHITTDEASGWEMALRNLQNLVRDRSVSTPPDGMEVVVNGPAVRFLLAGSPDAFKITKMAEAGVTVSVCSNSLERFDHDPEDIAEGATVVQSGVAEVVRAQQQGQHYLKLP